MQRILVILTVVVWVWLLYYGYTFLVGRTMKSAPQVDASVAEDPADEEKERKEKSQREKAQEIQQQQKQLMEERQRTLRYHQNR